jgi:hypothetical protein
VGKIWQRSAGSHRRRFDHVGRPLLAVIAGATLDGLPERLWWLALWRLARERADRNSILTSAVDLTRFIRQQLRAVCKQCPNDEDAPAVLPGPLHWRAASLASGA